MNWGNWLKDRVVKEIELHYARLSERYGSTTAKFIIAAALAGSLSPVPGSTIVAALPIVGLAELVKKIREIGLDRKALSDPDVVSVSSSLVSKDS